jgi:DNA-binding IclR family transcriptional regulator
VRVSGLAYDREELSDGICAIASGVSGGQHQSYAVSVVVPEQRFDPAVPAIRAALLACKEGIEAELRTATAAAA